MSWIQLLFTSINTIKMALTSLSSSWCLYPSTLRKIRFLANSQLLSARIKEEKEQYSEAVAAYNDRYIAKCQIIMHTQLIFFFEPFMKVPTSLIDVLTYTMHAAATLFAHSITYLPPLPPRRTSFELTLPNGVDLNAETLF